MAAIKESESLLREDASSENLGEGPGRVSLLPYLTTLFLGAFNDNLFKNAAVLFVLFELSAEAGGAAETIVTIAAGLFILPYLLFSATAGRLADKFDKTWVMRAVKAAEIPIMALAALAFALGSTALLLAALFLMGAHSSFFAPAKYGWIPDTLPRERLVGANALVELATFVAVLLGSLAGGLLIALDAGILPIQAALLTVAVAGFAASLLIPRAGARAPELPAFAPPLRETVSILGEAYRRRTIWLAILGISWFWALGSVLLSQVPAFARGVLAGDEALASLFVACFTLGIGLGSLLAGKLAMGQVTVKLVPLGALAMAFFSWLLWASGASYEAGVAAGGTLAFLADSNNWLLLGAFVGLATAGGLYIVPLNAFLQDRAPEQRRSRVIAANDIVNAAAMAGGAAIVAGLLAFGVSVVEVFLVVAAVSLVVAAVICRLLPQEILKGVALTYFRVVHRLEAQGLENAPLAGRPAVYVANHASFLDAALLAAVLPGRPIFAIDVAQSRRWWIRPLLHFVDAYPMDTRSPFAIKQLAREVAKGQQLVIFPEGRLTSTGGLMKIYEGSGVVAEKAKAAVVPVTIEGATSTLFSRLSGKLKRHVFAKLRVTVMPPKKQLAPEGLRPRERRQWHALRLYDVMRDTLFLAANHRQSVVDAVLEARAREGGRKIALSGPETKDMSYTRLATGMIALARPLAKLAGKGEAVGVLLPTAIPTAVTILALLFRGRRAAMLNFTAGSAGLVSACRAAELKTIVTSHTFVERAKLEQAVAGLQDAGLTLRYLEDIAKEISPASKIAARLKAIFARSIHRRERIDPNSAAVILFTSGSEGAPKGVVLSHRNLLSNCRQVLAMLDANPADRVFNALPLFHAFGLTGGLLMPLVLGARSYLYPSPLHSKIVAELVYDSQATIFFATDTFLTNYARVAHPYDFHAIRHIFAGAEKLREETRRSYSERFGKRILEGYGATECSPVIALNTPMHNKVGSVGRFVPALDWRLEPVEGVKDGGRLQVKGPNVMLGYLRASAPGELEAPEAGWYDTGDIVEVDDSDYVTILGRAKRFAKIAGEMVSLAAIEEALAKARPEAGHAVVSLPDPRKGEALVLFTTDATLDRAAITAILKDAGLPELAQPRRIETMEKLPLTGTGKVDLRALNEKAKGEKEERV